MNLLFNLTEVNVSEKLSAVDALVYGLSMVLIGMATVFAVLITIWFALILFKYAFHDLPSKTAGKPKEVTEQNIAPVYVQKASENEEIVAVIAAAIAMAENENSGMKFRVVSFKRK